MCLLSADMDCDMHIVVEASGAGEDCQPLFSFCVDICKRSSRTLVQMGRRLQQRHSWFGACVCVRVGVFVWLLNVVGVGSVCASVLQQLRSQL